MRGYAGTLRSEEEQLGKRNGGDTQRYWLGPA